MRRNLAIWALVALCAGLAGAVVALALRDGPQTTPSPIELSVPRTAPAPPAARTAPERRGDRSGSRGPRTRDDGDSGSSPPGGGGGGAAPAPAAPPAPAGGRGETPAPAPEPDDDDDDDDRDDDDGDSVDDDDDDDGD